MKILTIGGATQDIFFTYGGVDTMTINKREAIQKFLLFESGEKIEVESLQYHTGGGATNAAVAFSKLGLQASCISCLGKDAAGDFIIQDLVRHRVDTSLISVAPGKKTGVSAIINTSQEGRTIFTYRGANNILTMNKEITNAIQTSQHLYVTSLSNESSKILPDIVAHAKRHSIPVAINPGSSQLTHDTISLKKSLASINILILNSSEARTFMAALIEVDASYKTSLTDQLQENPCMLNAQDKTPYLFNKPVCCQNFSFSIPKFFETVLDMGPSIIVVTNGANGVYVATKNEAFFHPSIETNIINTVGAGDAFGSCFVASLLLGNSVQESLRNGVVNSASVLESIGAKTGLLTKEELKRRVEKIPPTLLQTLPL